MAILHNRPISIIKEPNKSQTLPSLVKILNGDGYRSSFWYGGDINFANFNSFVVGSGFQDIITEKNFNPANYNSKWGVHDHILFQALKDSMKIAREPFLKVILTLSSHEPFDVPMEPVFTALTLCRSIKIQYTILIRPWDHFSIGPKGQTGGKTH